MHPKADSWNQNSTPLLNSEPTHKSGVLVVLRYKDTTRELLGESMHIHNTHLIKIDDWFALRVSKFFPLSITVGEVEDLVASLQPSIPKLSVTLQWDVPSKNREDEITAYDIWFRPKDGDSYNKRIVGGACKTITLKSTSGIAPLTTYEFKVRARIKDSEGNWKEIFGKVITA